MAGAEVHDEAKQAIERAARRKGARERPLTDAMRLLLATDLGAARQVANLCLVRCDQTRRREALGAEMLPSVQRVLGEQVYEARTGRGRKVRRRRYDLLFAGDEIALAIEVKLDADLAARQLDDLAHVDPEALGLSPGTRLGVIVLGTRELEISSLARRHRQLLGTVRWASIIDGLMGVAFDDEEARRLWSVELLALYVRRGALGRETVARPSPRSALEAVAVPLRDHVQRRVGDEYRVRLDADRALHVTHGRARSANIELVIARRRPPRGKRRIAVWLEVPRGGRRRATIVTDGRQETFPAPARVEALQTLLVDRIDGALPR